MISELVNGVVRLCMAHTLSRALPLFIVNEFPRSGGTWLGKMLSDALGVPFPRNTMLLNPFRSCILHSHFLTKGWMRNVVILWRDGRDVMTSWYYHCLFPNDRFNLALVERTRREVGFTDYDNVEKNMPAFLEFVHRRQAFPAFTWGEFVKAWHGRPDVCYVKYEDLLRDPAGELERVVQQLAGRPLSRESLREVVEKNSFARMTGRQAGQEDKSKFVRKGIAGDWRNSFSPEARQVFHVYGGKALTLLGYESNDDWVHGSAVQQSQPV